MDPAEWSFPDTILSSYRISAFQYFMISINDIS